MQMSAVWFYVITDVPKYFFDPFFVTKRIFYFSREKFCIFLEIACFFSYKS